MKKYIYDVVMNYKKDLIFLCIRIFSYISIMLLLLRMSRGMKEEYGTSLRGLE